MGHVTITVGRDHFRPYFGSTMQCACEGLTFDSTDLHEFAYTAFANLAKVMGDEFSPVLGELVPHLATVIGQGEGRFEQAEEEQVRHCVCLCTSCTSSVAGLVVRSTRQCLLFSQGGQLNALDDSDEEDDGGNLVMHIRTALLKTKKGAIAAVGEMAAHTGAAFVPYMGEVITVLIKAADNWHPLIKAEVANAMASMLVPCLAKDHGGEVGWEKGDVAGPIPLSANTTQVVDVILKALVTMMKDDTKDVVGKACEGIQSVIELCGPHALASVANECPESTCALLRQVKTCCLVIL